MGPVKTGDAVYGTAWRKSVTVIVGSKQRAKFFSEGVTLVFEGEQIEHNRRLDRVCREPRLGFCYCRIEFGKSPVQFRDARRPGNGRGRITHASRHAMRSSISFNSWSFGSRFFI